MFWLKQPARYGSVVEKKLMSSGLLYGFGVNDAKYSVNILTSKVVNGKRVRKVVFRCPFYSRWAEMLRRCYSEKERLRSPTYTGCVVCEDWKYFSNFKAWMEVQDWEGKQLDKDILGNGKLYSPETCCFVDSKVNSFIISCEKVRGAYAQGVCWHCEGKKYMVSCRNPLSGKREYLGLYESHYEAEGVYLKRKLEIAKDLANTISDEKVADALVVRYQNMVNSWLKKS